MFRFAAFTLFCLLAAAVHADERIRLFESTITINADASLAVTETIRVDAEGRQIRRGIFRDFPLVFEDADGRERKVGFEVISVTRDGEPEPFRVQRAARAARIYIGDADIFLASGTYTYRISYVTDRQLRRFDTHDELFWNVTGTEWAFPIDAAKAIIRLPGEARATDVTFFTGAFGSREQNARASLADDGRTVVAQTTGILGPRQGLTVGVQFDKGHLLAPTNDQRLAWWWRDHAAEAVSVGGLLVVFAFYLWAWNRVGRDPPRDIIVPRWEPPGDVSPALAHYIANRGLKGRGFDALSAAALNLAVNGYLEFDKSGGDMTLRGVDPPPAKIGRLPVGERAVLERVRGLGGKLTIDKTNGKSVQTMANEFTGAIENEHRSVFFRSNTRFIVIGVILSVAVLIAALLVGAAFPEILLPIIPLAAFGIFLTVVLVRVAKSFNRGLSGKINLAVLLFFGGSFLFNIGIERIGSVTDLISHPVLVGAIVTLIALNVLFFFLMGAPTKLGQKRSAEIEGLKRYMSVAEQDRMNMLGSPQMSPQHYETLLPYAVALGVEKPWSEAFQTWLAAAIAAGVASAAAYHGPRWYRGDDFSPDSIGGTMGDLAGNLSSSMTSSLPAPKSSSSGFSSGGGFSGGGGGGGGGGGW